jgi:hypothetical protein
MTPLETVLAEYQFFDAKGDPLEFKPEQAEVVNDLAPLPRAGYYCETATGKTAMSIAAALFKRLTSPRPPQIVVHMPPILLDQWYTTLTKGVVHRRTGKGLDAVVYRGSPKQRKKIDLDHDFVLMSTIVFKNDYAYLCERFGGVPTILKVDEATSIKNIETDNYKMTRDFVSTDEQKELMLLTATPLSKPGDAYAYIKLVAPQIYRNQRHFEALHVEEKDFFDKVIKWSNLDLLAENLLINSKRLLYKQVWPNADVPLFDPMPYELDADHAALYKKLADEQILLLEDGGKIDATTQQRLQTMLQQIICNPAHFSGDPNMRSAAHELLDQIIAQLQVGEPGGRKLFIFANYKMTNRGLIQYLSPFNAVGFYSEVSQREQQENLQRFLRDPKCWIGVGHPITAGYGLDGLQTVCSDVFFPESPSVAIQFNQAVGRFCRPGQTRRPHVRIGVATKTVQVRMHRNLLENDALVNRVQGSFQDLKEAIYGVS